MSRQYKIITSENLHGLEEKINAMLSNPLCDTFGGPFRITAATKSYKSYLTKNDYWGQAVIIKSIPQKEED